MTTDEQPDPAHLAALGQAEGETGPEPDDQGDFAGEHDDTAVGEEIVTGADEEEREPESPRGWSGMES